jgi:phosphoglycerate kinase
LILHPNKSRRGNMAKLFIEDLDVKGRRVLTRVDFNVPLDENLSVTDNTRIVAALPTIKHIIENGGKAILMSHLGRPKKVDDKLRLKPAAEELGRLLNKSVIMAPDCIGPEVERIIGEMAEGEVVVLENLRFHKEEEANDPAFCEALARLGDVYVNDAFGTAHRAHASTVGVTAHFNECALGYLMQKEVQFLGEALADPKRPFLAILGGAKVSTKIGVMESLMVKADDLLIGGAMTYTFLRAMGKPTGTSLVEEDKIDLAREILEKAKAKGKELVFPVDLVVANAFEDDAERKEVRPDEIPDGWMGMDIGPKSIEQFGGYIKKAATILWNGPVGVFEKPNFAKGTFAIAKMVAESNAISIVGGGDSVSAINMSGMADRISHISTGGGASLEYIEFGTLPGIDALTDK